jgi:hypothetical protein
MSSITASKTVEIDREAIIEACAHLMAADLVFISLNDNVDSMAGEVFGSATSDLSTKALGSDNDLDDDAWATAPDRVEIHARAEEIHADVLERLAAREIQKHFPAYPRIEGSRELARKMRDLGTVDTHLGK